MPSSALLFACLAAVQLPPPAGAIENPSGTCEADDDGGRVGYHSPGVDDTYLPDCVPPLDREYWRVFAQDASSAYIIPRPDGAGLLYALCGNGDSLASLFERYGMCADAVEDPSVINSIAPSDALNITHALHSRLVFRACEDASGSSSLLPFAPQADVLDACELTSDADAQDHCAEVRSLCDSNGVCVDREVVPNAAAATALASALNALYGIDDSEEGRVASCSGAVQATLDEV